MAATDRGLPRLLALLLGLTLTTPGLAAPRRRAPAATAATAAPHGPSFRVSAELGGYGDTDAVYVASPTLALGLGDELAGWSLTGRYLVDAVSAASVDIVTSASSKWTEYRHVSSLAADFAPGETTRIAMSGGVSSEPDYLSVSGGASVAIDTLGKNFTPFLGLTYGDDQVGRTGEPTKYWRAMQKVGVQAGATFVIGRSTIGGLTLDASAERGYLGKPYRYIPLFEPGQGDDARPGASPAEVNRLRIDQRPADAVPEARDRLSITGRIAHRWDEATLRLDQRIYRDSWGLLASTTESRLLVDAGSRVILGPHVRLHAQRAVSFWQRSYEATAGPDGVLGPPRFRTGDRELGPLGTVTLGGGLRWRLSDTASAPVSAFIQIDGGYTRFYDALYITRRLALFSAVGIDAEID